MLEKIFSTTHPPQNPWIHWNRSGAGKPINGPGNTLLDTGIV